MYLFFKYTPCDFGGGVGVAVGARVGAGVGNGVGVGGAVGVDVAAVVVVPMVGVTSATLSAGRVSVVVAEGVSSIVAPASASV